MKTIAKSIRCAAPLFVGVLITLNSNAQTPKFQLITSPLFNSWAGAEADAVSRGGHLATFSTLQKWQQFTNFVGLTAISSNQWWVGANDIAQRGTYAWITGEAWSFTNWAPGEPSGTGVNGIEDYLTLNNDGTWNDAAATIQVNIGYVLENDAQTDLIKSVKPTFSNLSAGRTYQLQTSTDLANWTNYGSAFTPTNSSMVYTQYFDVPDWNQLFFRLQ